MLNEETVEELRIKRRLGDGYSLEKRRHKDKAVIHTSNGISTKNRQLSTLLC